MTVRLDVHDQAGLKRVACALTFSDGWERDAVAVAARDEAGTLLAVGVIQARRGQDAEIHWGAFPGALKRRDVPRLFADVAFRGSPLLRLWAPIATENAAMQVVALKCGWVVAGLRAGRRGAVLFRLDRAACPWLDRPSVPGLL